MKTPQEGVTYTSEDRSPETKCACTLKLDSWTSKTVGNSLGLFLSDFIHVAVLHQPEQTSLTASRKGVPVKPHMCLREEAVENTAANTQ